ncbi:MAG: trypsin-like peptidase domain-containing protein [Chloroflexi bacterium]|nr:trypsin-like peptidase domain-containing protein [Chloroflexota bacterium]MDA1270619.1 trypsin-like peptidase domain-containing protein [Chloroflexota bacterium]
MKHRPIPVVALIAAIGVLVGCSAVATPIPPTDTPQPTPTPTPDIAGTVEAIVSLRLSEVATVTPAPTSTVVPSATPVPTPTRTAIPAPTSTALPKATSTPTFAEVTARVQDAIVRIETPASRGSGTIIDSSGYILTNYHVVSGYSYVDIRIEDSYTLLGTVVGFDELKDIAIVKVEPFFRTLKYLTLSNRRPAVNEEITTIGYPLGLTGESTTTRGVVSAIRQLNGQTVIQTDAAINPGNSGGAAVDRDGKLIGIPTSKLEADNIGFLVPSFDIANQIPVLKGGFKYALVTPTPFPTATPRPTSTPWPSPTPAMSAYEHFMEAEFLYNSQQYYQALIEYSRAIEQTAVPDSAYYNNRGNVYYVLGFYHEAVDDYTQAVQISGGTSAINFVNRSYAWQQLGRNAAAEADITSACRLDTKYC